MEPRVGAEARVTREDEVIVKERVSKGYRHPAIDAQLIRERTKREARVLERLQGSEGIPSLASSSENTLRVAYIEGPTFDEAPELSLAEPLARILLSVHEAGVSHGDVSPKNVIIGSRGPVLIDFGLAQFTDRIEDRAIDLTMTRETFSSYPGFFEALLEAYRALLDDGTRRILDERIGKIDLRGRNKQKNR